MLLRRYKIPSSASQIVYQKNNKKILLPVQLLVVLIHIYIFIEINMFNIERRRLLKREEGY
jgi:hypothetical protein